LPYRVIVPKRSAIDIPLSPSTPRGTGDTGDGGPSTGDELVISGDGPVMAGLLAHPQVRAAMYLFDGEVTQVRFAPPRGHPALPERAHEPREVAARRSRDAYA
jgi:hypothetical protein